MRVSLLLIDYFLICTDQSLETLRSQLAQKDEDAKQTEQQYRQRIQEAEIKLGNTAQRNQDDLFRLHELAQNNADNLLATHQRELSMASHQISELESQNQQLRQPALNFDAKIKELEETVNLLLEIPAHHRNISAACCYRYVTGTGF